MCGNGRVVGMEGISLKCKICGSTNDLLCGVNFSRDCICKECLEKEDNDFAKDLEVALRGPNGRWKGCH